MACALSPVLRAIYQQEYYVNPRFHASIAWALLPRPHDTNLESMNSDGICIHPVQSEGSIPSIQTVEAFPTVSRFPPELITLLIERYSTRLSSPYIGAFDVEKVVVKIGKEITSWRLLSM